VNPTEFLDRVLAVVDDLALLFSHTPRDRQEDALRNFAQRLKARWQEALSLLPAEEADGIIADVVERVRARSSQMKAAGTGRA
jgi:hypothetical protein